MTATYRVTASQQAAVGAPPTWLMRVEDVTTTPHPAELGWCYRPTIDAMAAMREVAADIAPDVDPADVQVVVNLPTHIVARLEELRACGEGDRSEMVARRARLTRFAVCRSLAAMGVTREDVDLIFRVAAGS